jgi:hypothetical protein
MNTFILLGILAGQLYVAQEAYLLISQYKLIFNNSTIKPLYIRRFTSIPIDSVTNTPASELVNYNLRKILEIEEESAVSNHPTRRNLTCQLIHSHSVKERATGFIKIMNSLNAYLLRNSGSPVEFATLQDITNRHLQVHKNKIEQALPVPLYLGLVGTLISAAWGLGTYSKKLNIGDTLLMGEITGNLISEIAFAMICSLSGVIATTYLSYWAYRPARQDVEDGLNTFYNFIQAELLPHLSVTSASAIKTLEQTLTLFNSNFAANLQSMSSIFNSSTRAMEIQQETYEAINKLDINKFILASAKLSIVIDKVEVLGETLSNTAEWLHESRMLVLKVNELLETINGVERTVSSLENGVKNIELLNNSIEKNVSEVAAFAQGSSDRVNTEMANISSAFILNIRDKLVPDLVNQYKEFSLELTNNGSVLLSTMKEINNGFKEQKRELIESLRTEHKNLGKLDNLTKLDRLDLLRDVESSLRSIDRTLKMGNPNRERGKSEDGKNFINSGKEKRPWYRKINFWNQS